MVYDADGLRVRKEEYSGTTKFVWDDQRLLLETDGNDATQAAYTSLPENFGQLVSQRRGGASQFYHLDALGSVVGLTDSNQAETDCYGYDAFGDVFGDQGTTVNPFRYVGALGYYYDAARSQYYVRARHYDPSLGRWLSRDPLAPWGNDENAYRYVENAPAALVDPSGMQCYSNGISATAYSSCSGGAVLASAFADWGGGATARAGRAGKPGEAEADNKWAQDYCDARIKKTRDAEKAEAKKPEAERKLPTWPIPDPKDEQKCMDKVKGLMDKDPRLSQYLLRFPHNDPRCRLPIPLCVCCREESAAYDPIENAFRICWNYADKWTDEHFASVLIHETTHALQRCYRGSPGDCGAELKRELEAYYCQGWKPLKSKLNPRRECSDFKSCLERAMDSACRRAIYCSSGDKITKAMYDELKKWFEKNAADKLMGLCWFPRKPDYPPLPKLR